MASPAVHEVRAFTGVPEQPVEDRPATSDRSALQIMAAVRTDVNPDSTRKRRLKPSARVTPRLDQAPVHMTGVNEAQPPDFALVRLFTVVTPTLRAPAPPHGEQSALPHPEQSRAGPR